MTINNEHKKKGRRVAWSEELHRKFVVAVNILGIDKAVPKKILALMNDENLTKENVASHLQKYRLHLKRISSSCVPNQKGSLIGSGQFHYNAAAAADASAQNVSPNQFGHAQNSNNTTNDHVYQNGVVQAIPISEWHSNQSPDSLTNDVSFQWWDDYNQDASYHSNVIGTSINSLTPLKGAVDPKCHTSTNSTFKTNLVFNLCDPLQMKHDGNEIMELTAGNSLKQQHKSQNTCIANNLGFIEGSVTAASSSCSSQESAEISELRQEMAAIRDESHRLREIIQAMMAQQDMLMQAVLQVVPPNAMTQQ